MKKTLASLIAGTCLFVGCAEHEDETPCPSAPDAGVTADAGTPSPTYFTPGLPDVCVPSGYLIARDGVVFGNGQCCSDEVRHTDGGRPIAPQGQEMIGRYYTVCCSLPGQTAPLGFCCEQENQDDQGNCF